MSEKKIVVLVIKMVSFFASDWFIFISVSSVLCGRVIVAFAFFVEYSRMEDRPAEVHGEPVAVGPVRDATARGFLR